MIKSLSLLALAFFCSAIIVSSCSPDKGKPFQKDIEAFKKADTQSFPPANAILFVGSSSFTKWTDVSDYFPGYTIINRGFGGSKLTDVIQYADQIIIPYKSKQIVIYCGENDIAGDPVAAEDVLQRFVQLFNIIRKGLPDASIAFISMKPSPSREKFLPVMDEVNNKIREFLSNNANTAYIDVYHPMLDSAGKTRPELFLKDMLHMNPDGYVIWQKEIQPHLLK